jgi:hypothetical protein
MSYQNKEPLPPHQPANKSPQTWSRAELNAYGSRNSPSFQASTQFDGQLRQYVEQLFEKYDTNRSGTLDLNEVHLLFNEVLVHYGLGIVLSQG